MHVDLHSRIVDRSQESGEGTGKQQAVLRVRCPGFEGAVLLYNKYGMALDVDSATRERERERASEK
eukprot:563900-Pleurochrysis_carterae.AAC.1